MTRGFGGVEPYEKQRAVSQDRVGSPGRVRRGRCDARAGDRVGSLLASVAGLRERNRVHCWLLPWSGQSRPRVGDRIAVYPVTRSLRQGTGTAPLTASVRDTASPIVKCPNRRCRAAVGK